MRELAEAVYTLAAAYLSAHQRDLTPDQAAEQVALLRHEVRWSLQNWKPPADSYRSEDLPR